MSITEERNPILKDIKTAIISEMISFEFYSKSSVSVKLITSMHAFQDMMWEEEKHVKRLKEEYKRLGGKEEIKYDPHGYGGIALPKLNVDAITALDVAMKEESSSIKMYNEFLKKNKGTEAAKLFEQLLNDEKKHLEQWNAIYKDIKDILGDSIMGKEPGNEVYRFTNDDLEVIKTALKVERAACDFYNNAVGKTEIIDGSHAFQHMAWEEKKHVEKLEGEYFRLVNEKPPLENKDKGHTANIKKDTDALVALELSIKEEKASLKRYLELEERCTNTRLREVIWELTESEWNHINEWRSTYKAIKEKNFPLY